MQQAADTDAADTLQTLAAQPPCKRKRSSLQTSNLGKGFADVARLGEEIKGLRQDMTTLANGWNEIENLIRVLQQMAKKHSADFQKLTSTMQQNTEAVQDSMHQQTRQLVHKMDLLIGNLPRNRHRR